jgi:hypothetical protein
VVGFLFKVMAKNWWFKFEYRVWKSDPELAMCSLSARGLWLEILCHMYDQDASTITCSFEQLARMTRCEASEAAKYALELKTAKVADVTLGHGEVTVMSRRLEKLLKARKQATLRKRKERVTDESQDRVKVRVISKEKEEEKREERTPTETTFEPERFTHPAVLVFEEIYGFKVGSGFATSVAQRVKNLGVWKDLLDNKRAYADKPLIERRKVQNWILDEYDKRAGALVTANGQPKKWAHEVPA